jgi:hypothetical protein
MECHAHAVSIGMMQESLICVILGTALTMEAVGSLEKSLKKTVYIFAWDIPLWWRYAEVSTAAVSHNSSFFMSPGFTAACFGSCIRASSGCRVPKKSCLKIKINTKIIATRYGLEGPGIESRWGEIFRTYPDRLRGPPSLLYSGYRVFTGRKGGRGVMLTTHPLLVSRLRKSWAIPPLTPWVLLGLLWGYLYLY